LAESRIIVAVIGKSWIAQMTRLDNKNDWVRQELSHAQPGSGRALIPVYLGTAPGQISDTLPSELAFIKTANSHFIWPHFETQQKDALQAMLTQLLGAPLALGGLTDTPRLELLCDRIREENCLRHALRHHKAHGRKGGWLLFGESNQGQNALFERMEMFSLKQPTLRHPYPDAQFFNLHLHDCYGYSLDNLFDHLVTRTADALNVGEVSSVEGLYRKMSQPGRKISLAVFWSVVHVSEVKQAKWWESRFKEMIETLPKPADGEPQILLALAISYEEKKRWLNFLSPSMANYMAQRFPGGASSDGNANRPSPAGSVATPCAVSRLLSAEKSHVEDWCGHRWVQQHIKPQKLWHLKKESLKPFEHAPQIPMETMIGHLAETLSQLIA
jgi:hypothetical protein